MTCCNAEFPVNVKLKTDSFCGGLMFIFEHEALSVHAMVHPLLMGQSMMAYLDNRMCGKSLRKYIIKIHIHKHKMTGQYM